MLTVLDYVVSKLAQFGLSLSETDQTALLIAYEVEETTAFSADTLPLAEAMLAARIPELLAMADITEGGYSIKRDRAGISLYYAYLCRKYDLLNLLEKPVVVAAVPTITDRSNCW